MSVAITHAAALGGIPLNGKTVRFGDEGNFSEEIKKTYRKRGFIPVKGADGDNYKVTWGRGHFGTLKQAKDYDKTYAQWHKMPLPFLRKKYEIKLRDDNGLDYQWTIVKKLFCADDTAQIYSVTDYEREGELIFAYVYELTGTKTPWKRIKITESTEDKIKSAYKNPLSAEEVLPRTLAAKARSVCDFIVGANLTAYETLRQPYKKGVKNDIIKAGRVKTPTLYMVYQRDLEIKNFVPSSRFEIDAEVCDDDGVIFTLKKMGEPFETENEAKEFIKNYSEKKLKCIDHKEKSGVEYPPNPYNTLSLQKDASARFKYNANDTLDTLQTLYQPTGGGAGYITYPRTDSEYLTSDKKGAEFFRRFDAIRHIPLFAKFLKYNTVHDKYFNDSKVEGHDAIILTGTPFKKNMSDVEKNLLTLIAKRMIAMTYPAAKIRKVKTLFADTDGNQFTASGVLVEEEGFLKIYPRSPKEAPPTHKAGDLVGIRGLSIREVKAVKPSLYTTGTLLEAMETCANVATDKADKDALKRSKGIGRPSTRGPLVKDLEKNGYISISKKDDKISITPLGIKVIDSIHVDSLKSPLLTADWEQRLDEIEMLSGADRKNAPAMAVKFIRDIEKKVTSWVT
jgi:DNA topoisomerase-3